MFIDAPLQNLQDLESARFEASGYPLEITEEESIRLEVDVTPQSKTRKTTKKTGASNNPEAYHKPSAKKENTEALHKTSAKKDSSGALHKSSIKLPIKLIKPAENLEKTTREKSRENDSKSKTRDSKREKIGAQYKSPTKSDNPAETNISPLPEKMITLE